MLNKRATDGGGTHALTDAPRTLEEVKAHADPVQRARAAVAYLARLKARQAEALAVRNDAVRLIPGGPKAVAEKVGLGRELVKWIRRTK